MALGVACVVGGRTFLAPLYFEYPFSTAAGWCLTALGLLALWSATATHRWRTFGYGLLTIGGVHALDELLIAAEVLYQPLITWVSYAAAAVCESVGLSAAVRSSTLVIDGLDGVLYAAPSVGLLGLRVLLVTIAAGAFWMAVARIWSTAAIVRLVCFCGLVFMARYLVEVVGFGLENGVLGEQHHVYLATFWNPWAQLLCIVLGCTLGFSASKPATPGLLPIKPRAAFAAVGLGLVWGALLGWQETGEVKPGRVLIDDRLSGVWEPAAPLLHRDRFGDFSTYSFASATETLSRRFAVTVNASREYTEDYLDEFDVLVVKTPNEPFEPEEREAVLAWIARGGGLFAISDHTDLSGMSSYFNDLLADAGIRFGNDSVKYSDGRAVVVWDGPSLCDAHPISHGCEGFSFMTSCSVSLSRDAVPVMVTRRSMVEFGDYAKRSNFGSVAANASVPHGGIVVAAAASYGRGRIVAFTDSTVLSSFSFHRDHHDTFFLRSVAWLNHTGSEAGRTCLLVGIIAWAFVTLAWLLFAGSGLRWLPVLPIGLLAVLGGHDLQRRWEGQLLSVPAATDGVVRMGIVADSPGVRLPPVLGTQPEFRRGTNLSTLVQIPQRLGIETEVVPRESSELADLDALCVLNPVDDGPASWRDSVRSWVDRGGTLFVWSRAEALQAMARLPYLTGLDAPADRYSLADGEIMAELYELGAGRIVSVVGTELLDTEGLGHCMAHPKADQRRRYGAVLAVLERLGALGEGDRRTYLRH